MGRLIFFSRSESCHVLESAGTVPVQLRTLNYAMTMLSSFIFKTVCDQIRVGLFLLQDWQCFKY